MKAIFFLITAILLTTLAKSQSTPINSTIGSPPSAVLAKGVMAVDSAYWYRYSFPDTLTANKGVLKNDPGVTILVAGSEHWMRNQAATKWILITGGAVDNNQWFGPDAFAVFKNGTITTATQNLAIGQNVLKLNTAGIGNTGLGFNDLANTTSGNYNTASGYVTLRQNLSGSNNTGNGANVLLNNTTGNNNTASGYNALTTLTISSNNTASGYNSLASLTTGASNTSIGANSMLSSSIASWNVSIGDSSNFANIAGHGNVDMGYQTGSSTGGDYNIRIGYRAGNHPSQMATPINSIAIGAFSKNTASNQIVLGDSAHTELIIYGVAPGSGNATVRYDTTSHKFFYGSPANISGNNGVTDSAGRIILGGSLYKTTGINTNGYGFVFSSTSSDGILTVSNSGTSGGNTYGGSFSDTKTDDGSFGSINYGMQGTASGAFLNVGVVGVATSGSFLSTGGMFTGGTYGMEANAGSNSAIGLIARSFPNGSTSGAPAAQFYGQLSYSSEILQPIIQLVRSGGIGVNGAGGSIDFIITSSTGQEQLSNQLISYWTNATNATRTSQFDIIGVSNAVTQTFANFQTGGVIRTNNNADTVALKSYVRGFVASLGNTIYSADDAITSNRIVNLNGKVLTFSQGGNGFLSIDPTAGAEEIDFRALNTTGGSNQGGLFGLTSNTDATTTIKADFNGSTKLSQIVLFANTTTSTATITATSFNIASTLGGTSIGYGWILQDPATGRGAWAALPGGGGAAWNGITAPTGSLSLAFDDGEVSVFTNGSNTETFFTTTSNSLTTGIVNLWQTNSISTGNLASFVSTSTAANGFALVNINSSGANASSGRTSTLLNLSNTNTGTTSTDNGIVMTITGGTTTVGYNITANTNILTPSTDNSTTLVINSAAATSRLQLGTLSGTTTSGAIYGPVTASSSNYGLAVSTTESYLNAVTDVNIRVGNTAIATIYSNGVSIGNGNAAPNAKLDVLSTTEQLRVLFDASNYYKTTVASNGAVTFDAVGAGSSFRFSDIVNLGTAASTLGQLTFNGNTSGTITVKSAAAAGTWSWTIPTTAGANNYDYMATDGTGVTRWQAGFNPIEQTLTDGVSITWNVNNGGNAVVTLGAAGRTLVITNAIAGQTYTLRVIQDGTGSRTITTWPTNTKWPNNGTQPTLSTAAGSEDIIVFYTPNGTNFRGNYNFAYQ